MVKGKALQKNGKEHTREHERALARAAEAIIFAADDPVPPARIAEVYAEVTGTGKPAIEEVEAAVEGLNEAYEAHGRVFRVHRWAEGYRMATHKDVAPFVKTFFSEGREKGLSRALLETLAVVAYRQPVTRPEIEFVRGVSADYAVRKLLEYGLIDVEGRADTLGRPLLYGTTPRFMEAFGLESLDDLPTLREIEELLDDPHFNKERAELLTLKEAGALEEADWQAAADEEGEAEADDSS